jgi:hypothetical protein
MQPGLEMALLQPNAQAAPVQPPAAVAQPPAQPQAAQAAAAQPGVTPARILEKAGSVVALLQLTAGLGKPVIGSEYDAGAELLDAAVILMQSAIADSSSWSGSAADSYNSCIRELIQDTRDMAASDLKVRPTVETEADHVKNVRITLYSLIAGCAAAIPVAWAIQSSGPTGLESALTFASAFSILTTSTALAALAALTGISLYLAKRISMLLESYDEAKWAVENLATGCNVSSAVSVDPAYLTGLAATLQAASSDVEAAIDITKGFPLEILRTHGVVCGETCNQMQLTQAARKGACHAVRKDLAKLSNALNSAASAYQDTDLQQQASLDSQYRVR